MIEKTIIALVCFYNSIINYFLMIIAVHGVNHEHIFAIVTTLENNHRGDSGDYGDDSEKVTNITMLWNQFYVDGGGIHTMMRFAEMLKKTINLNPLEIVSFNIVKYSQKHNKFIEYVFVPGSSKYKKGDKIRMMIGGDLLPMDEIASSM